MSDPEQTAKQHIDALDLSHLIGYTRDTAAEMRSREHPAGLPHLLERLATELYQSRTRELRAKETAHQAELAVERAREQRARQRRAAARRQP